MRSKQMRRIWWMAKSSLHHDPHYIVHTLLQYLSLAVEKTFSNGETVIKFDDLSMLQFPHA